MAEVYVITGDKLKELAHLLADMIKTDIVKNDDPYLPPSMIVEQLPALSLTKIRSQIREGKYGKKIGEKGKLVAKVSEVKNFNRL